MTTRRNVQYTRLPDDEDYDGDGNVRQYDPRFDYTPKSFDRIPWKSIVLALFLLFLGLTLLFLSYFIFTGHMGGERSQAYGLLALGILTFLPDSATTTTIRYHNPSTRLHSITMFFWHNPNRLFYNCAAAFTRHGLRITPGEVPKDIALLPFLITKDVLHPLTDQLMKQIENLTCDISVTRPSNGEKKSHDI
ncbi:hypothetical protein TIFTF001_011399 [Ficus carica]|uniref:Transmembrane protein 230 n=1 Tax=Ficus carica TaxID=3494 RepID=A0AA88ALP3_FICCA|nr:hypothetical protein TIFTF001_011399 [Ficus carica]